MRLSAEPGCHPDRRHQLPLGGSGPVVVREPGGIAVGIGSEHEQKIQYLQRELKPVDHRVGIINVR